MVLLIVVILARRSPQQPGQRSYRQYGITAQERAIAAQAEIEEHDIQQMLEAQNALRRRIGHPTIGDELAEEIRREPPEEPDEKT